MASMKYQIGFLRDTIGEKASPATREHLLWVLETAGATIGNVKRTDNKPISIHFNGISAEIPSIGNNRNPSPRYVPPSLVKLAQALLEHHKQNAAQPAQSLPTAEPASPA